MRKRGKGAGNCRFQEKSAMTTEFRGKKCPSSRGGAFTKYKAKIPFSK